MFTECAEGKFHVETGLFSLSDEKQLLLEYEIDTIVSKNSGGATYAKIIAARELGIKVVMAQRAVMLISAVNCQQSTVNSLNKGIINP